ncbi:MAG TPA: tetratricopeptide repeat protein [Burkholderiales bacterium]|nr:tetratricopeptide repeat protein [Burkholderiales bacterium]
MADIRGWAACLYAAFLICHPAGAWAATVVRPVSHGSHPATLPSAASADAEDMQALNHAFKVLTDAADQNKIDAVRAATLNIIHTLGTSVLVPHELISVARELAQRGRLAAAQAVLDPTISAYPDRADAVALLGHVNLIMGNYSRAIDHLRAALDAGVDWRSASRLGLAYELAGNIPAARAALDRAYSMDPRLHDLKFEEALLMLYSSKAAAVQALRHYIKQYRKLDHGIESASAQRVLDALTAKPEAAPLVKVATDLIAANAAPFVLPIAAYLQRLDAQSAQPYLLRALFFHALHMVPQERDEWDKTFARLSAAHDPRAETALRSSVSLSLQLDEGKRARALLDRGKRYDATGWYQYAYGRTLDALGQHAQAKQRFQTCAGNPAIAENWRRRCEDAGNGVTPHDAGKYTGA